MKTHPYLALGIAVVASAALGYVGATIVNQPQVIPGPTVTTTATVTAAPISSGCHDAAVAYHDLYERVLSEVLEPMLRSQTVDVQAYVENLDPIGREFVVTEAKWSDCK